MRPYFSQLEVTYFCHIIIILPLYMCPYLSLRGNLLLLLSHAALYMCPYLSLRGNLLLLLSYAAGKVKKD